MTTIPVSDDDSGPDWSAARSAAAWVYSVCSPAIAVLYEDGHLLAVVKPAGLVTHPTYKYPDGTLTDLIFARQAERGERRPWLLHRLDRETSGIVLFAKTEAARRGVVRQFERRTVRKQYLAVTAGVPPQPHGMIEAALARDPTDRRRTIVVAPDQGQPATTRYSVLASTLYGKRDGEREGREASAKEERAERPTAEDANGIEAPREIHHGRQQSTARAGVFGGGTPPGADASAGLPPAVAAAAPSPLVLRGEGGRGGEDAALILAEPLTGRTHQIRAHLASVGAPLAGDTRYLSEAAARVAGVRPSRALLHAWRLTVTSPATGQPLTLVAPIPADLRAAAVALGLGDGLDALDTLPPPDALAPSSRPSHPVTSFALSVPSPDTPAPEESE